MAETTNADQTWQDDDADAEPDEDEAQSSTVPPWRG